MPAFFPDAVVDKVRRSRKLEAIVFWTKDVRNLVRHAGLAAVSARIPSVVQFTVTGLAGTAWEPRVPPLLEQLGELRELGKRLPPGTIRWRFDPIIPDVNLLDRFRTTKSLLEQALGEMEDVTVSFPDPYRHAVARAAQARLKWPRLEFAEKTEIISALSAEFTQGGGFEAERPVRLCCEPELLTLPGVGMGHCIDGALFEKLYNLPLGKLEKDPGQRLACGCVKSTDIGSYAMRCSHRCLYCYANPE